MVLLPPGAQEARAAQKEALAGVVHDKATSPELGELLSRLASGGGKEKSSDLDEWALANVREAARDYRRASAIDKALAQRKAALESAAYNAWVEARSKGDFAIFAPFLEQWVEVCRLVAAAVDPEKPTYDVLLDEYEVGATEGRVLEIFECVKAGVVPLRAAVLETKKKKKKKEKSGVDGDKKLWAGGRTEFDPKIQEKLCQEIALDLGFSTEKGRLDTSVHPFTGGSFSDVRMTTRYKIDDVLEGVTGTTHETGHAIYEQQRPAGRDDVP